MAPLIVQIAATLAARWFRPWRDAVRVGLAAMLAFTAASHFSPLRFDLAAMIPPPFTGNMAIIYVTGLLELAGAVGLVLRRTRRAAAACLIALLVAMFPANAWAALNDVRLGGSAATPLWLRTPLQIFWIAALAWSGLGGAKVPPGGQSLD